MRVVAAHETMQVIDSKRRDGRVDCCGSREPEEYGDRYSGTWQHGPVGGHSPAGSRSRARTRP